jgi:hypothetical protein
VFIHVDIIFSVLYYNCISSSFLSILVGSAALEARFFRCRQADPSPPTR